MFFCINVLFSQNRSSIASSAQESNQNESYNEGGGATKSGDYCPWEGPLPELFTHLKTCTYKPMKCPFNQIGCNDQLKQKNDKQNEKLSTHYTEFNVIHQNLILSQINDINSKISTMQQEIAEVKSILLGPGGFKQELAQLKQLLSNVDDPEGKYQDNGRIGIGGGGGGGGGGAGGGGGGDPGGIKNIDTSKNILIGVGCNEKGDLGIGNDENIKQLQELQWSRGLGIVKIISCSYKAFGFLTSDKNIYVCGCNDFGQLGLNNEEDQWTAKLHPFFDGQKLKILDISRSINAFHVCFICYGNNNNQIYCCGANEYGQLGLDDQENYVGPQLNNYFNQSNINIISIACGEYHTLFLSSDGSVYSCGINESFQLGYKTANEYQKKPKKIVNINKQIKQIAAGRDHSYCLDIDGNVWSFGSNYRGQLGIGNNKSANNNNNNNGHNNNNNNKQQMIHKISWFENQNKKIIEISSGNYHGAAIDRSGNAYVWGRGDEGQIGNGKKADKFIPTLVDGFDNIPIRQISCGCHHTIGINEESKIFCWGNNRYNQCSDAFIDNFDGQHHFTRKPQEYYKTNVESDDKLINLSAGSYHTLLLLNKP